MRCGSGSRAFGRERDRSVDDVAAIAWQLDAADHLGRRERGLANWPAMRPTFTTGTLAAKVSTTAICSSTRKVSRMLSAVKLGKALGAVAALQQEVLLLLSRRSGPPKEAESADCPYGHRAAQWQELAHRENHA
jgi:hypothetical protein